MFGIDQREVEIARSQVAEQSRYQEAEMERRDFLMKSREMIIIGVALAVCAAGATACSPQATASIPDVLTVQLLEDPAAAQTAAQESADEARTVTVTASETVKVTPDMARIVYEITTEDADAVKCQQKNSETLDAVIAYLKEQGVAENSIKTSDFSLSPKYDWSGNRQRLIGYEMDTRLEVSDVAIDMVGKFLSGAVNAGANRIWDVTYYASGYDEAYAQALELAMEMAKEKAETLAHAGGCQVTDVLSVEEHGDYQAGRYVDSDISRNVKVAAMAEDSVAEVSVMAGEMEVGADITVVYRLLPR